MYNAGFSKTARICAGKPGICGKPNIPCHRLIFEEHAVMYVHCPIWIFIFETDQAQINSALQRQ